MEGAYIKSPTHPASLHPSPTAPVTIATEEEVGIFKGQAAAKEYPRRDYNALHAPLLTTGEIVGFTAQIYIYF